MNLSAILMMSFSWIFILIFTLYLFVKALKNNDKIKVEDDEEK